MKISDAMTGDVVIVSPDQTIRDAAKVMAERDIGVLPVGEKDRLVGVITDRDIAVRAVAEHLSPDTPVEEVMSEEVLYCHDDEDIEQVAKNMGDHQVRRLPVVNRDKRLVGIVSFADISHSTKPSTAGEAIAEISEPGGKHSQTAQIR